MRLASKKRIWFNLRLLCEHDQRSNGYTKSCELNTTELLIECGDCAVEEGKSEEGEEWGGEASYGS